MAWPRRQTELSADSVDDFPFSATLPTVGRTTPRHQSRPPSLHIALTSPAAPVGTPGGVRPRCSTARESVFYPLHCQAKPTDAGRRTWKWEAFRRARYGASRTVCPSYDQSTDDCLGTALSTSTQYDCCCAAAAATAVVVSTSTHTRTRTVHRYGPKACPPGGNSEAYRRGARLKLAMGRRMYHYVCG